MNYSITFYGDMIVLMTSLFILIYSIIWGLKHRKHWYVVLPNAFYFLHSSVFYAAVIYPQTIGTTISVWLHHAGLSSEWSLILRLHGMITMLLFLIIASACIRTLPHE